VGIGVGVYFSTTTSGADRTMGASTGLAQLVMAKPIAIIARIVLFPD
jgi:hypothetical protein